MSFLIAAPASGHGKTTLTLGLLAALRRRGHNISCAKSGPDYIDPEFHAMASGAPCINLDAWAMSTTQLHHYAATQNPLIVEGAMGLFDGAVGGGGSCADLAKQLGLPILFVVDASRQAQSIAALVYGFLNFDSSLRFAGVILNNVGSERHAQSLMSALAPLNVPVLGAIPKQEHLHLPSRHLGLVQAHEHDNITKFIQKAADCVSNYCDIQALEKLLCESTPQHFSSQNAPQIMPPAQNIAVAKDAAFSFIYPHLLEDWHKAGAQITLFSPLANEPVPQADLIYLPGGYPELYARQLSSAQRFMGSLKSAAQDTDIFGECGGYMTLGDHIVDASGKAYPMAGLLPLATSFFERKRQLGYRVLSATSGPFKGTWRGHEYHYATTCYAKGEALFEAWDSHGASLGSIGLRQGRVCGSFAHLIAPAA